MKQYVEIYWTPWLPGPSKRILVPLHLLTQQPDSLISVVAKERPGAPYIKCPAFIDACRNGFVVKSPVDINIALDHETKTITTDRYGQEFYDCQIENRGHQSNPNNPFLISLFPRIVFYAKESVEMEQSDLIILPSPENVKTVPGKFDISKWIRPIEWAIEVDRTVSVLSLKAGDPLFMVRFKTQNNLPVKLIRVDQSPELVITVDAFTFAKNYRPNLSFKNLYELSKSYLEGFWRRHK